ncbi:hypothetical protein KP79_PYT11170 [Mizuhopecten yessoensis]|uniref:Uncharacterized protein n=1 Tax=Mizuhopecten yessoensis TaxID=6573 RepID=A0A210R4C1_MIZYE|nr:hypothetical protein KP79_PYT11170 [Mizuhopecten yessoensis]
MANISEVSTRWGPWSGQTFELLGFVNSHTHFNNDKGEVSYDVFGFKGHTGTSCFCRSVSRPLYRRGRDIVDWVKMTKVTCVTGNVMDYDIGKTEVKKINGKEEDEIENDEEVEDEDIHDPES